MAPRRLSLQPPPFTGLAPLPRESAASPGVAGGAAHTALIALGVFLYSGARLPVGTPGSSLGAVDPTNTAMQLTVLLGSCLAAAVHWRRCLALLGSLWPFLMLAGFLALSSLWSDYPAASLRRSVSMLTLLLFTLSACAAFGMRRLMKRILLTLLAIAAAGIATAVLMPGIGLDVGDYADAVRGLYVQKNSMGLAMLLAALGAAYLVIERQQLRGRDMALLAAILAMTALSRSTTAMLLCMVTGLATALLVWLERGGAWTAGALAGIGFAVVLGLATFAVLDTEALLELLGKDSTLTGRTSIWDATWRAIGERPLLGHGYSAFWNEASPTVQLIWIAVGWETPNAHSGFLEILLQLGWVGLGLVVLLAAGTLGMALLALVRGPRGAGLWVLLVLGLMGIVGRTESTLLNPDLLMLFWMAAWLAVGSRPENPASRMHRCFEGGIR